ncbi:hypothetical protein PoB_002588600 [Plakobranchus ocellatus]|uniref:Uncharacterized protein n=1 Tax=Plakobranchus ocellatus TaxID=259542 RepID=A0AAV3ZJV5_9GAST|nr:hypothetical protein PoB_002588600 [Plakobranchus ocellatus]
MCSSKLCNDRIHLTSRLYPGAVSGTVVCESALRSAETLLSQVRAPPSAPRPDGGPYSLRSPCCGLPIYNSPPGYAPLEVAISGKMSKRE